MKCLVCGGDMYEDESMEPYTWFYCLDCDYEEKRWLAARAEPLRFRREHLERAETQTPPEPRHTPLDVRA